METETERIVIVDDQGRVYDDATRAIAENRARSAAQQSALARGYVQSADLLKEAEYVAPTPVNPVPAAIVPFVFPPNAAVKPEQLNANLANIGNLIAGFVAREKLYLQALDSLTDRVDRMTYAHNLAPATDPKVATAIEELREAQQAPRRTRKPKEPPVV